MQPDDYFQLIYNANDLQNLQLTATSDWGQGRTVFGGLSSSILYEVLKRIVPADRELRSVTFNFVGPIKVDHPFGFSWQVLREGKNATQITASIIQEDEIRLTALACFAKERQSEIVVEAKTNELPGPPDLKRYIKLIPNVTPDFLSHIDMSISEGGMPYSGSRNSSYKGWMRLKQSPIALTDAHILLLIDAWPPTILQMPNNSAPASTMSWNVEFIHPFQTLDPNCWLAYEANTIRAYGGYAHSEAQIRSDDGELIAVSRQLIAIFD